MALVFFITAFLLASTSAQSGYDYPKPDRPLLTPSDGGQQTFPQFPQPSGPGYDYNRPQPQPVRPQPQPIQPQPVRPQPQPIQPQPVRPQPQPIQPQPVRPQPQPIQPQPVRPQPQPIQPQPVRPQPQPIQPQPVRPQPQPIQPQPVRPQPQPIQPQPVRPQPQPIQPSGPGYEYNKPVQPVRPQPQPARPQPIQPQPVRPQPKPIQPQPVRPQPQPNQPQPIKPQPQPNQPQPVRPQPQPVRPQPIQPQPVRPPQLPIPVRPLPQPIKPQPVRPQPTPQKPSGDTTSSGYNYPVPSKIFQEKPSAPRPKPGVVKSSALINPSELSEQRPNIGGFRPSEDIGQTTPTRISLDIPTGNDNFQEITQNTLGNSGPQKTAFSKQTITQQNRFGVTSSQSDIEQIPAVNTGSFTSTIETGGDSESDEPSQNELTDITVDYSFDIPSQEKQDLYQQIVFGDPKKNAETTSQLQENTIQTVQPTQGQNTAEAVSYEEETSFQSNPSGFDTQTRFSGPSQQQIPNIAPAQNFQQQTFESQTYQNQPQAQPAQQQFQQQYNNVQISAVAPAYQQEVSGPDVSQVYTDNRFSSPVASQSPVGQNFAQIQTFQQSSGPGQTSVSASYQQQQPSGPSQTFVGGQQSVFTSQQQQPSGPSQSFVGANYQQPSFNAQIQQTIGPSQGFVNANYQQPSFSSQQQATSFNNNFGPQVSNYQQTSTSNQGVSYQQSSKPSSVTFEQVASIGYDYPLPNVPFNSGVSSFDYQPQSSVNQAVFGQQSSGYNYQRPSRSVKLSDYNYPAEASYQGNYPSYIYKSSVTGDASQQENPQVTYQSQYPNTQRVLPTYYQTSYQYAYKQPQVTYHYVYKDQPNQYEQVTNYQVQPGNYQIKTENKYHLEAEVSNPILTYTYSTPLKSSPNLGHQEYHALAPLENNPIQNTIIYPSNYQNQNIDRDFEVSEHPAKNLAALDPDLLETIQSLLLKEEIQINNKEKKNAPTANVPFDSYGVPINQKTVVGVALESFQPAVIVGQIPKPKQIDDYETEPIVIYGPPTRN